MSINIYKDQMQKALLFGGTVLYTTQPIPREDVPRKWFCCDLCGADQDPHKPYSVVDQAEKNYAGTVLSYLPLKGGRSRSRLVKDMFHLTGETVTLEQYCADEHIRCPQTPDRLCHASQEEAAEPDPGEMQNRNGGLTFG